MYDSTMSTLRNKPTYFGEDIAQPLIEFMNQHPNHCQRERSHSRSRMPDGRTILIVNYTPEPGTGTVERLVSLIHEFEECRDGRRKEGILRDIDSEVRGQGDDFRLKAEAGDVGVTFRWDPRGGSLSPEDNLHAEAVQAIVELSKDALVSMVRRCANPKCGTWFFRRRQHQEYCSRRCLVRFLRTTPAYRAKQAKLMKQYRRNAKKRERERLLKQKQSKKGKRR